jgi:hypothetical protein
MQTETGCLTHRVGKGVVGIGSIWTAWTAPG